MELPKLQWSAAEVQDGTLRVELSGDRPKGWKSAFAHTAALLGGGDWGEVTLKGTTIRVDDVHEGTEDQLRHFLEGAVQEANARRAASESDADEQRDSADSDTDGDGDDDTDTRMTERFRDFGAA